MKITPFIDTFNNIKQQCKDQPYHDFYQQNKKVSYSSHHHLQAQHGHQQPLLWLWPWTLQQHSLIKALTHWKTKNTEDKVTIHKNCEEPSRTGRFWCQDIHLLDIKYLELASCNFDFARKSEVHLKQYFSVDAMFVKLVKKKSVVNFFKLNVKISMKWSLFHYIQTIALQFL